MSVRNGATICSPPQAAESGQIAVIPPFFVDKSGPAVQRIQRIYLEEVQAQKIRTADPKIVADFIAAQKADCDDACLGKLATLTRSTGVLLFLIPARGKQIIMNARILGPAWEKLAVIPERNFPGPRGKRATDEQWHRWIRTALEALPLSPSKPTATDGDPLAPLVVHPEAPPKPAPPDVPNASGDKSVYLDETPDRDETRDCSGFSPKG